MYFRVCHIIILVIPIRHEQGRCLQPKKENTHVITPLYFRDVRDDHHHNAMLAGIVKLNSSNIWKRISWWSQTEIKDNRDRRNVDYDVNAAAFLEFYTTDARHICYWRRIFYRYINYIPVIYLSMNKKNLVVIYEVSRS